MNYLKALYCRIKDHAWSRPRKGEYPGIKTCRRCGAKQNIRARVTKPKAAE